MRTTPIPLLAGKPFGWGSSHADGASVITGAADQSSHKALAAAGVTSPLTAPAIRAVGLKPRFHGQSDHVGGGRHAQPIHQDRAVHLDRFFGKAKFGSDLLVEQA